MLHHLTTTPLTDADRLVLKSLADSIPERLSAASSPRQRWLKMATNDPDRAGDVLVMSGMDATNFQRNPQFLWQHGMSGEPVNTIGTIRYLHTTDSALYALAEYATADVSPLAEQIYQMDLAGYLPANSLGFRPIAWEPNDTGGTTFVAWELIECSKVELPMNPNAIDDGAPDPAASHSAPGKTARTERSLSVDEALSWLAKPRSE